MGTGLGGEGSAELRTRPVDSGPVAGGTEGEPGWEPRVCVGSERGLRREKKKKAREQKKKEEKKEEKKEGKKRKKERKEGKRRRERTERKERRKK